MSNGALLAGGCGSLPTTIIPLTKENLRPTSPFYNSHPHVHRSTPETIFTKIGLNQLEFGRRSEEAQLGWPYRPDIPLTACLQLLARSPGGRWSPALGSTGQWGVGWPASLAAAVGHLSCLLRPLGWPRGRGRSPGAALGGQSSLLCLMEREEAHGMERRGGKLNGRGGPARPETSPCPSKQGWKASDDRPQRSRDAPPSSRGCGRGTSPSERPRPPSSSA